MKKLLFFALAASCAMTAGAQSVFTEFTETSSWKGDYAAVDIDNDGDLDVIYSAGENSGLGFTRINNGDGTFTVKVSDNTKIEFLKSAIQDKLTDKTASEAQQGK